MAVQRVAQGTLHERTRPLEPNQLSLGPGRVLLGAIQESFALEEGGGRRVCDAGGEGSQGPQNPCVFSHAGDFWA